MDGSFLFTHSFTDWRNLICYYLQTILICIKGLTYRWNIYMLSALLQYTYRMVLSLQWVSIHFSSQASRRPAPRLFCDICDVFDLHDTDDCPQQTMDDTSDHTQYHGERGANRAYCTICEGKKRVKKSGCHKNFPKARVNIFFFLTTMHPIFFFLLQLTISSTFWHNHSKAFLYAYRSIIIYSFHYMHNDACIMMHA